MPTLSLFSRWESGYFVWVQRHAHSQAVVSVGIRLICLGGAICLLAVCCLGGNQAKVSGWSDMPTRSLLSRWDSAIKIHTISVGLVQSGHHHLSSTITCSNCSRHDIARKLLNDVKQNHSLTHFSNHDNNKLISLN